MLNLENLKMLGKMHMIGVSSRLSESEQLELDLECFLGFSCEIDLDWNYDLR